jgi:hypothetical protein
LEDEKMKKSYLKRSLFMILIISFLFVFCLPFASNFVSAATVTNVQVSVYPSSPYVNAQYTITFQHDVSAAGAQIIISGLQASQAPLNQSNNVITVNNQAFPALCTFNGSQASIFIYGASINTGSNTIIIPLSAGLYNPAAGTYQISLNTGGTPASSAYYQIGTSQISNLNVQVAPPLKGTSAQYQLTFKTSANGPLTANTNNIYVQFPLGTGLPYTIPGSYVTVNGIPCSGTLSVDTINRILTIPVPLNIYGNNDVTVIISNQAAVINPSSSGSYMLTVWTTTDSTYTTSNAYNISSSFVSSITVSPNPATVGTVADYTIQFTTSSEGALTANSDTISVSFPSEMYVPNTGIQASYVSVNNQNCSSVTASGNTLTIKTPVSVGANSNVKVIISKSLGIKNPSKAGTYKINVSTSKDLSSVESQSFSITATTLSDVYIVVTPPMISENASYMVQFNTGSEGVLALNDFIKVVFPTGSYIPQSVQSSSVSVNGSTAASVQSSPSDYSITVILPQNFFLSAGGKALVSISASAGIKNPSTSSDNYYISVSTSKEQTPVKSTIYSIYGALTTNLSVIPVSPDGKNGYYISKPQITLKLNDIPGISASIYYHIDQGSYSLYSVPFTLDEGTHTVYYYSKTASGLNEQEKSVQFKVDVTLPTLSISSPKEGETVHQNPVQVKGVTEVDAGLTVNGQQVVPDSNGNFSYAFSATEGVNSVEAVATDMVGNINKTKLSFIFSSKVVILLQVENTKAYLNNEEMLLDATPFIYKGRVMVPLRFLSDSLHAVIEWDQIFKIATVTLGNSKIRVQVGNNTADVGGKAVALDVPPVIVKDRVFVPIRFISENFGALVEWDDKMQIVKITYPKP